MIDRRELLIGLLGTPLLPNVSFLDSRKEETDVEFIERVFTDFLSVHVGEEQAFTPDSFELVFTNYCENKIYSIMWVLSNITHQYRITNINTEEPLKFRLSKVYGTCVVDYKNRRYFVTIEDRGETNGDRWSIKVDSIGIHKFDDGVVAFGN